MSNPLHITKVGAGPAVVFLHGAGVDHHLWTLQLDHFSEKYLAIAVDLPGHGESDMSAGDGGIPAWAGAVRDTLHAKGINEYAIIGLSQGGMVAMEMASRWPDEVKALVLAEASYGVKTNVINSIVARLAMGIFFLIGPRGMAALPAKMLGAHSEAAGVYLKDALLRTSRQTAMYAMRAAYDYDGRNALSKIKCPTLVLAGEHNPQTRTQGKEMAQMVQNAVYSCIARSAHILNIDAPKEFNKLVQDHLESKL